MTMILSQSMAHKIHTFPVSSKLRLSSVTQSNTTTAASCYELTDLGTFRDYVSVAKDINDSAQIVGYSINDIGQKQAFVWDSDEGMQDIGTIGNNSSCPYSINDYGQVVGSSVYDCGQRKAFIWDKTKGIHHLDSKSNNLSEAYCINNSGQVVGFSVTNNGQRKAFIWDETKGIQNLSISDDIESSAYAINYSGQVVGYSVSSDLIVKAFIWNGDKDIQELPGFLGSDINRSGQVIGFYSMPQHNNRAFLWNGSEEFQDLGTISHNVNLQFFDSEANSINDFGLIVGSSDKLINTEQEGWAKRAFIWDSLNKMQDLNDLIDPSSGWVLKEARSINNHGQIVGWGMKDKSSCSFLLTPIS
ncbi:MULTISPECIES: DUF3466 family protein [unclassified Okeania]|uniref:DUF3466 family protein n=2 Tax=Okeania TaxID=1458928 RepID=UPI0013BC931A|nr:MULTISPECIES: DUF3466 family protein [unclassified Okeania]NET13946.1 DUF3466 family protein [Okeania sp. SIO1H6]NET18877.1 DUF3466 family protein [Okeania sp. SIO1H5]